MFSFHDVSDRESLQALQLHSRQVVGRPWTPDTNGNPIEIHPDISIGIAFSEHGVESPDQLLHDADLGMYEA
jgi:GGDEF domain-containing protein